MAEGAGIVILEEYEAASKRGAKIYGEVCGYGLYRRRLSSDGACARWRRGGPLHEDGTYHGAGLNAEDVDYINAHGTSTPFNDLYETMAIKSVFRRPCRKVMVSSTKSMTGHCLGAAGGVEAVYLPAGHGRGEVPPTINYQEPDPECDLDYVPNEARQAEVHVAMSNSFGFGGTNATLLFRKV